MTERHAKRHRHHRAALLVPVVIFPVLWVLPWNPIYPAITALGLGGIATIACRRDLAWTTVIGGLLFLGYYAAFMFMLEWSAPGYIARVWNGHRTLLDQVCDPGQDVAGRACKGRQGLFRLGRYEGPPANPGRPARNRSRVSCCKGAHRNVRRNPAHCSYLRVA
jgi:hypothetical protein